MCNCHSWPLDVSSNVKMPLWTTRCQYLWGSIGQSRFICQVWCSSIQGIYAWFTRGPSAKVGSSAKFGVAVCKASILDSLGGTSAKVGSSAKFGVAVCKASILNSQGGPLAKVGSSAQFSVAVSKASILDSLGVSRGLHLTSLYNANWLFTTLIMQK